VRHVVPLEAHKASATPVSHHLAAAPLVAALPLPLPLQEAGRSGQKRKRAAGDDGEEQEEEDDEEDEDE
jgi:hypothetical protein